MKSEIKPELKVVSPPKNLQSVPDPEFKGYSLATDVEELEGCGGELQVFLDRSKGPDIPDQRLFNIEGQLSLPENKALKQRWQKALRLSAKIRMDLLRCKAFDILEGYENKSSSSSATDIAFAKTMLIGVLMEDSEMVKSRYRPAVTPLAPGQTAPARETQEDAVSDLENDFDAAGEL